MKLNYKRTFFIGLAFLSISAFWQMYDNIIPLMLQDTFGLGETVTGFIMAADNVLALFLLPIFGSLSDRVDTPLGKRMPFIVGGTALAEGIGEKLTPLPALPACWAVLVKPGFSVSTPELFAKLREAGELGEIRAVAASTRPRASSPSQLKSPGFSV